MLVFQEYIMWCLDMKPPDCPFCKPSSRVIPAYPWLFCNTASFCLRIAYAYPNISLAYGGIVFWQSILDVLLRVLSFQLPMSSRYVCKNDGIRNNCDVVVPNHECH